MRRTGHRSGARGRRLRSTRRAMSGPGRVLQEGDTALVVTTVVECTGVQVKRRAVFAAIADDAPCRHDAFASRHTQLRDTRSWRGRLALVGVAQRQNGRLIAPHAAPVYIPAVTPVLSRAVIVTELEHQVVASTITEGDPPHAAARRLRIRAAAGRRAVRDRLSANSRNNTQQQQRGQRRKSHAQHQLPPADTRARHQPERRNTCVF
jgi:hypothetical protein